MNSNHMRSRAWDLGIEIEMADGAEPMEFSRVSVERLPPAIECGRSAFARKSATNPHKSDPR